MLDRLTDRGVLCLTRVTPQAFREGMKILDTAIGALRSADIEPAGRVAMIRSAELAVTVLVREGTHYLAEPLVFGPGDSGSEDGVITYAAYPGEQPVLSGGRRIAGEWRPYKDGIWMCSLPEATGGLDFDQLFVNGRRVHRARFPNYDAENPRKNGGGYILSGGQDGLPPTELNFDPKTFDRPRYAHPKEAVLHCFQTFSWGNLIWRLRGIDYERNCFLLGRGGWQMNTLWSWWAACAGEAPFYIENVFEELDAPGEWYLDRREGVLYYMPLAGEDMTAVVVEAPLLTQVAEFRGSQDEPVRHITLRGFKITHTAAVYLEPWEAPSLGDFYWQGGYGASSVSQSNVETVRGYIARQIEHHRKMTFQEEFREFLKRHQIQYDERYVWD